MGRVKMASILYKEAQEQIPLGFLPVFKKVREWYDFFMTKLKKWGMAVCPLLLPILCTAVIHHFFQTTFGENNLTLGIYSRDIYIPLGMGALFSFYRMVGNGVQIYFRTSYFLLTLSLLIGVVVLLRNYLTAISNFSHPFLVVSLLMASIATLMTSFLITLKLSEILAYVRRRNSTALYALIAVTSLLNYPLILKFFWREASYLTAKSVFYVYRLFGVQLKFLFTPVSFNLSGGGFAIRIIMGCSGLEGIFFFIFAFSLIQCLERKSFNFNVAIAYGLGSILLFLLNTVRIASFYLLGIELQKHYETLTAKTVIESVFHNHIGWILYLLGISGFIRAYRKWESLQFHNPC
jgi:exosortase/archaeosortase family protein